MDNNIKIGEPSSVLARIATMMGTMENEKAFLAMECFLMGLEAGRSVQTKQPEPKRKRKEARA